MADASVIILDKVAKHYCLGDVIIKALDGVSFQINRGECVGITGPSGSGKTTLLYIIGCLMKPTTGNYIIDNCNASSLNEFQLANLRNSKVGFIFQAFNILPRFNALENVILPMVYAKVPWKERRQRAEQLLSEVGLSNRMHHKPSQLSGGEQQRVAIARALVNDPAIILADEPTGNLDSASGNAIMEILLNLNRRGRTVIIVTHEKSIAEKTGRVIKLLDGKVVQGAEK